MRSAVYRDVVQAERASLHLPGTPSINTLTCLPAKPSSMSCITEPTPPDYGVSFPVLWPMRRSDSSLYSKFFNDGSHCVECRSFDSADRRSYHHFIQFGSRRFCITIFNLFFPSVRYFLSPFRILRQIRLMYSLLRGLSDDRFLFQ